MKSNETFTDRELSPGRKDIGDKGAHRRKMKELGNIIPARSRLVVLGYQQEEDIDYSETFAASPNVASTHLRFATAVK